MAGAIKQGDATEINLAKAEQTEHYHSVTANRLVPALVELFPSYAAFAET